MASLSKSRVDVLVIGAGPAGLMLCTWLARLGVNTRLVERRFRDSIKTGQADGLQSRTFEILDSLGVGQQIWAESNHVLEIRFWSPDQEDKLRRSGVIGDSIPGLSRFQQAALCQARIEEHLLGYIDKYSSIAVEYGVVPESLHVDVEPSEENEDYPVSVALRHLSPKPGQRVDSGSGFNESQTETASHLETVQAKYVVGCDGAHSWTRRQTSCVMEGESTDYVWGVLDIIPITDFPDIRYRCAIHSSFGSMMVIPREDSYVRLYIQVDEVKETSEATSRFSVEPGALLAAAKRILAPYSLSYKHCSWWTTYRIGQRVGSKFSELGRIFLTGDAVHTHSPKAGQGMNVSMHDAYNLGWKLAYVARGWADESLLKTYDTERSQVAKDLIEFDHKFSRLFSGRPQKDITDKAGVDMSTFRSTFEKSHLFTSGCAVNYASSIVVQKPTSSLEHSNLAAAAAATENLLLVGGVGHQSNLAIGIPVGMRLASHKVLNQSDARPWHLQERLPSTGAWRIIVFAGDIQDAVQYSRYKALGAALSSPYSFIRQYNAERAEGSAGPQIEILTVHSAPRLQVELLSLPDIFHPFSEEHGWDYDKVFVDDESYHEGHGRAYEKYGIDPKSGCAVIVRPDQYVSWVGALEDVADMEKFFSTILRLAEYV